MGPLESAAWFLPQLALIVTLGIVLVLDLVESAAGRATSEWPGTIALIGGAAALVLTVGLPPLGIAGLFGIQEPVWLFGRMLVADGFATFFLFLLGLAFFAVTWMSLGSAEVRGRPNEGEYYVLLVAAGLAMLLMAGAANLLMAYLALEFVSLVSYVLTGFLPHDRRSGEAALKYLIYGGVASGAMIYGMSWLFGLTGTMDYAGIAAKLGALDPASRGALFVALLLVLAGFGYKIAAVPFHMWAPDVYTGAPIPVTAFLAVGSKAAGFAMLLRFFGFGTTPGGSALLGAVAFPELLALMSAVTMSLGNLAAMSQTNMKRLLAYSSVAHAGYALLGVVVFAPAGIQAVLFYLAVYYLMNLGAFWAVMLIANATGREDIDAYRGLAWRGGSFLAVALAVFLFSLAGLPPLAGFVGKFYVFAAGIQGRLYWLVMVGVLNSVVSLYYYARIVKTMFLDQPRVEDRPIALAWADLSPIGVLSVVTIYLGVRFGWLLERVNEAGRLIAGS